MDVENTAVLIHGLCRRRGDNDLSYFSLIISVLIPRECYWIHVVYVRLGNDLFQARNAGKEAKRTTLHNDDWNAQAKGHVSSNA